MKKFLSIMLTLMLVGTLSLPAYADSDKGKGNDKDKDKGPKTYIEVEDEHENETENEYEYEYEGDNDSKYGLPYGLYKKEVLPYGLEKREHLPYGLDKRLQEMPLDVDLEDLVALIAKAEVIIALNEDDATYADAIEDLQDELDDAKAVLALEEEALTPELIADAVEDLQEAIDTFEADRMATESEVAALEALITTALNAIDDFDFDGTMGNYPIDGEDDLMAAIAEANAKIDEPMTIGELEVLADNIQTEYQEILYSKYALESEIIDFNDSIEALKLELNEWIVADEDLSLFSNPEFVAYYRVLYFTQTLDEDGLFSAQSLTDQLTKVLELREAYVNPEEDTETDDE